MEKLAKKAKDPVRATLEAIANKLAHTRICSASVTSPSSQGDRTEYAQCEGVRRRGIQGKTKRGSGEAVECSPGDDRTLSSSIFPNSFLFICRRRTPTTPAPASPSTLWCGPSSSTSTRPLCAVQGTCAAMLLTLWLTLALAAVPAWTSSAMLLFQPHWSCLANSRPLCMPSAVLLSTVTVQLSGQSSS